MPDWNENNWRRDGLTVVESVESGRWIILPGDDKPAMAICPCCGIPFGSQRAAKLIADKVYPLEAT